MSNQHSPDYKKQCKHIENNIEEIRDSLNEGKSLATIAKDLSISYNRLYRYLRKTERISAGELLSKQGTTKNHIASSDKRRKIQDDPVKIESLYWDDEYDLYEIAYLYNCTPATVLSFMRKHNIKRRSRSEASLLVHKKKPWLREVHRQNALSGVTGYPANTNRESWIEKSCRVWLEDNGYEYDQEFQIHPGTHHYDFKVGKILIEMDGEYWHTQPEQVTLDRKFEQDANAEGYSVVRITDKELQNEGEQVFERKLSHII
jgi:very-short-patch-repair endonuclease